MGKNYFNLNEQAILFCNLNKMPQWWKQVLADKELYVNIRKNDRVNVYYHGYSVMELTYKNRGNKGFNAKIHYKYLPDAGPNQNGYIYVNPEIIISNIRDVKKRIDKYSLSNREKRLQENQEGYKELSITGNLQDNVKEQTIQNPATITNDFSMEVIE